MARIVAFITAAAWLYPLRVSIGTFAARAYDAANVAVGAFVTLLVCVVIGASLRMAMRPSRLLAGVIVVTSFLPAGIYAYWLWDRLRIRSCATLHLRAKETHLLSRQRLFLSASRSVGSVCL
jgi:hypothetical protein